MTVSANRVSDERLEALIKLSSYGSERRHAYEELARCRLAYKAAEAKIARLNAECDEHASHVAELYAADQKISALTARNAELEAEIEAEFERLKITCATQDNAIEQTLGKALWYPRLRDDEGNLSGDVCVGEHTAESLAMEAAAKLAELGADVARLKGQVVFREDRIEEMQDQLFRGNSARHELESRLAAAEKWLFDNQYKVQDQQGAMELAATIRAVLPQPTKGA